MKKILWAAIAILGSLSGAQYSYAWDGNKAGKITRIDATYGNNYDIRVYLDGEPMCGDDTDNWAYINYSYENYQATVALLTSAWLAGRPVRILTTAVSTHCAIGHVIFQ